MKLFKKRKLLLLSILLLTTSFASSCSAFFGDDGYLITSTSTTTDENGNIVLTLNFSGDENKPMNITIPKGISGKDGVGIKSVTPKLLNDKVQITIKFTDDSMEDTVIEYPIVHGKDGKGIADVIIGNDERGNITIKFIYTDQTVGETITIPKGNDGNGIANILTEPITSPDGKQTGVKVTVEFTATEETTSFEVPFGKDGLGIKNIFYDIEFSDNDYYAIRVEYEDGTSTLFDLPVPKSTVWYADSRAPIDSEGKDGDFYINTATGDVYQMENLTRIYLFSMRAESALKESFFIRFNPNGGGFDNGDGTYSPDILRMQVTEYTQISLSNLEIPHYEGHRFLGWYTTSIYDPKDENYNPNSGKLTDLTMLTKDTFANATFYAWWERI